MTELVDVISIILIEHNVRVGSSPTSISNKTINNNKIINIMKLSDIPVLKHRCPSFNTRQSVIFPNGYGLSIITGENAYSDKEHPYEIAVIKAKEEVKETLINPTCEFEINYDFTDGDVVGYLTEDKVNEWLNKVEHIKKEQVVYLARDKDGELYLYENEPKKCNIYFKPGEWETSIQLDANKFPEVTWENSPVKVELIIKK